jgi:hypothetical protein
MLLIADAQLQALRYAASFLQLGIPLKRHSAGYL